MGDPVGRGVPRHAERYRRRGEILREVSDLHCALPIRTDSSA
jgi:hypothetical protein